jgi:RNA ligase
MKYSITILNDYIERGLVVKQDHPTLPLSIYNYSRACQYGRMWDRITLDCRGLVLDNEGGIIAKPFQKFFNMEELSDSEIPNEPFEVFEKMDGSLGICFYYNDEWHVATRGSFVSEQAVRGKELLKNYPVEMLSPGYTYLFEIIYPENRVVCDYGSDSRLVMLACIDCSMDAIEANIHVPYYTDNFDVVKKYDGITDFSKLKDMVSDDKEGYVIRFQNCMRMKIKGEEYLRLHKIVTNVSNVDIWDMLRTDGDINELLERVPDEFDKWVHSTIRELKYAFYVISERAGKLHDYFRYGKYGDVYPEPTKKEFAEYVMKQEPVLRPIMFAMWNSKPYDHIIWKAIRPKYAKPFRKDLDN